MKNQTLKLEINQPNTSKQIDINKTFHVPVNVRSIAIEVKLEKRVWLTYMVYDEQGNLRAQFMKINAPSPQIIHVEQRKASPNTVAGAINEGNWRVELSIFSEADINAHDDWCELEISFNNELLNLSSPDLNLWQNNKTTTFDLSHFDSNKVMNNQKKWYKGDLHTHTVYSDGEMTREENMESAKKQNLDFFFATDHNIVPTSWFDETDILVIPGVEVTSYLGHFNILNTNTSPFLRNKLTDMYSEEGMNKIITDDYGEGLISINHPFLTEWKWLLHETPLDKIDTLEIWNDPTYVDNPQATEWALIAWDYLLNDGYTITGVGGSDAHLKHGDKYEGSSAPSLIGDPGTFVYCDELTATNVVNGLKEGNVTVSRGELVTFQIGDTIAGKTMKSLKGIAEASVDTDDSIYFEWIVDGAIVKTDETTNSTYEFDLSKDEAYHWIRVNVRHEDGRLYGFSNPIYYGEKQPSMTKWGQLLDIMKRYMD